MNSTRLCSLATSSLAAFIMVTAATAAPRAIPDNTPPGLRLAADHGAADPTRHISITVQLALPDRDFFDRTVAALYRPGSPTFHKWLTDKDLKQFAPPAARISAVCDALTRHGLKILSVQKNGFSVRASGAIGDVARAFNTEIHEFERNGQMFRANIRNASLDGAAAGYVDAVAGLESHRVRPMLARAVNNVTKKPFPTARVIDGQIPGGIGSVVTDQALSPAQTFTYTTQGAALPTATYGGVLYDANASLAPDFAPRQLEHAYGLPEAYKVGLDGTGQTVVLLEGFGYPTIEADANAAAKLNGLPALTAANFKIVYPEGKPDPKLGILEGWNIEIALDVQSSHAIAPGAKILVVATYGQDSEDFQASMQYIVDNNLGYSVSDSWEEDQDISAGAYEQESFEDVLEVAAAKGVSFQFSTGDGGDGGLGTPLGAPGVPAVAPHAVAVGGTAILNVVGGKGFQPVGWGDAEVFLDDFGPFDPPEGFYIFGGGGGESIFWPKPVWQESLPGSGRQTPDISALADPYTGFPIVITDYPSTTKLLEPGWGGTSLASPIFTAIWAIANQKAGHSLGQASPTIAGLTTGVTDVLPVANPNNVSGSITDSSGTTNYSTKKLFKGLIPDKQTFTGALWNQPQYSDAIGFGFGLDSSLTVTPGWDNATGYGTPDGLAFINAAAAFQ